LTSSHQAHNLPILHVKSTVVSLPADFVLTEALAKDGMAFIRDGEGFVTRGQVIELSAVGPGRISSLASQWRHLCSKAVVDNANPESGRGLIALGSVAFDDQSQWRSVLTVPHQILGFRGGRAWLTTIELQDFTAPTAIDESWIETWPTQVPIALTAGQLSEVDFEDIVASALEHLGRGDAQKVVLSRDIEATVGADFDPRPAIARMAKRYPTCWTYWVNGRFGASPELLVRVDHGRFSARVLAGTAARGTDPDVDRAIASALTSSPKNAVEHRIAVESLVNALEPFCNEIVADPSPFSLALPNVWHLASDVQGILSEDSSVLDLAEALHPTAAVAGTPRDVAFELIRKLEPFDRGSYAGPVGWIGADGDGEWVIALRGAALIDGKIVAHAGCGIVPGSSPEAELAETELKFKPIRQALA